MVRGGRVGEIKEIFSKVTGSSKGSLCKSHGFVFCLLFFFGGGPLCAKYRKHRRQPDPGTGRRKVRGCPFLLCSLPYLIIYETR